jgi:hypothetical protein
MQNWLFCEARNFAKQPVSFAKQRNLFRIKFREIKSETSFAGNPINKSQKIISALVWVILYSTLYKGGNFFNNLDNMGIKRHRILH